MLEYLDLCAGFWRGWWARRCLRRWYQDIEQGRIPDFKATLHYGTGERRYISQV